MVEGVSIVAEVAGGRLAAFVLLFVLLSQASQSQVVCTFVPSQ